ncbi:polyphenol oxidase family protein [Candidatus Peregrinibacteria bacterium]|nr:polyphenol oxidase family protein [Candidatus Peregrinibacteria bacterium]
MMQHPFSLLQPFRDRIDIAFFMKEDDILTDEKAREAIDAPKIASVNQVHGNRVIRVKDETHRTEEADGFMTDVPGLALSIRIADCQGFLVYAPDDQPSSASGGLRPAGHVLGLIHAGWRGLEAGVIPSFFKMLEQEFGIAAETTYVGAVPSLGKECAEFSDPKNELPHAPPGVIDGNHADLQLWADIQLENAGVRTDRRERMEGCTKCDSKTFWTYRGGDREAVKEKKANVLVAALR